MEQLKADFWIGDWRIQPSLNRMVGPGQVVQLEPRIMGVLLCLAKHQGNAVTRDTLLETVWPDVIVGDDPLNRAISELRKIFGDDPRHPAYIETIRKVGYRLIAPLSSPADAQQGDSASVVFDVSLGDGMLPQDQKTKTPKVSSPRKPLPLLIGGGVLIAIAILLVTWWSLPERSTSVVSLRPMPLTSLPGVEVDPMISHDGNRVAFAWNNSDETNYDIYVRLMAEEMPLRLTTDPAPEASPIWSPDDQYIVFSRRTADTCGIYQIPALGGIERKLADCTNTSDLVWSPDGAWIAFSDQPTLSEPYSIYLLSTETLEVQQLTTPPSSYEGDRFPAFSPDSQTLAFVRSSIAGLDYIYTLPVAGGRLTQQSTENQRIRNLIWAENETLLYESNWAGTMSLFERTLGADSATWLLTGADGVHHATLSKSGRLVYEEWHWDKNMWSVTLNSEGSPHAEPFLASTRWDRSPQISPDGERVLFISNRSGSYEILMWEQSTERFTALTRFDGPNVYYMPRWSPDGRYIVYDARSGGNADIYVLAIEGGRPQRLTTDVANDVVPSWSPDGQWIYFGSNRSGSWEVWKKPVAGGEAEQVTHEGGYAALASADGEFLYYTKGHPDGLWRRSLASGTEVLIIPHLRARDWGNWALTPTGIYFVDRSTPVHTMRATAERTAHIAFYDFAAETSTPLYHPEKPVANPGLAVSPDGTYVLYVQMDESESDLMMVERGF